MRTEGKIIYRYSFKELKGYLSISYVNVSLFFFLNHFLLFLSTFKLGVFLISMVLSVIYLCVVLFYVIY